MLVCLAAEANGIGAEDLSGETTNSQSAADDLHFAAALSQSFAATENVDATVRQALGNVMELLQVEAGALFLLDESGENPI